MQAVLTDSLAQYGIAGIFILFLAAIGKTLYEDGKKREDYIIEKNEEREQKYQLVISENQKVIMALTKNLKVVEEMKKDIDEIKTVKSDVKELKDMITNIK